MKKLLLLLPFLLINCWHYSQTNDLKAIPIDPQVKSMDYLDRKHLVD